jgi:hypothetical protein
MMRCSGPNLTPECLVGRVKDNAWNAGHEPHQLSHREGRRLHKPSASMSMHGRLWKNWPTVRPAAMEVFLEFELPFRRCHS